MDTAAAPAKPSLRATLLRQAAQYSVGTGLSMFSGIARAGVAAKFMSAEEVGAWLGLQVLLGYASNLHFGSLFGMFRSVPIKIAQGDRSGAEAEERTTLSFMSAVAALGVVVGLVVTPIFLPHVRFRYIAIALVLAAVTLLKGWAVSCFKAERRFGELSVSSALGATFSFVSIALIPKFGLDALLGGMTGQGVVEMFVIVYRKGGLRFGWSNSILLDQFRVGYVTLITTIGITALTTIERTTMLRTLGVAATGTFVIGAQIVFLVPVLAAIPQAVLTPIFFERVGRGEDLMPAVEKPVMMLGNGFSWIIAAGLVSIDAVVSLVWPHLVASNPAAKYALIGTFPVILAGPVSNVFYALNRQWPMVWILAIATVVTAGATWLGVQLIGGITGASAGATVGLFVYYVLLTLGAFRVLESRWSNAARFLVRSLVPMLYACLVVLVCDFALSRIWPTPTIPRAALAEVIVAVTMAPWLRRALTIFRSR